MGKNKRQNRHRSGKTHDRHGNIEGLDKLLRKIEQWPEVTSVFPAEIRPASHVKSQGLSIRVMQAFSGKLICVAQRTGRTQKLVIVTRAPHRVETKIGAEKWGHARRAKRN